MGKLTRSRKITLIVISTIVVVGILPFILVVSVRYMMGDTSERRALWRDRSKSLIADMRSGISRDQVINIAKEHGFPENQIYMRNSEICVSTPGEFGATNWIIRFGFLSNKLSYIKVRTDDNVGSEHNPKGAPEDIVYK